MMHVLHVVGTRSNFMKEAVVLCAMAGDCGVRETAAGKKNPSPWPCRMATLPNESLESFYRHS